ncbi:MAG: hypothetical protein A3A33_03760 [Candidatus Yanofskybacteria bacterium RIFCSPLOWO2_01_FULL_49_25]|uniref:Uncharacterized protein n=1 Tax=Candidatus Yanofskybacteria bacterium RIFCSPLOWO2_01_FULL_49_25 TaxID=1802701 RepID=A0A1F8GV44_9BACT|nr:MAG: hypothetical protein A3A33_03760 [Candidatus Yanofskybacteria bacterium RIFCSPLOWO2_01_FULL_49_25]
MLNRYFFIYVATIIAIRIWLWYFPKHAPKIGDFQSHHYMVGLVLIAICLIVYKPILLAIGSALVVDEIPLFFIFKTWNWPDDHWKQYHSWESIAMIVAISLLGYFALQYMVHKPDLRIR